MKKKILHIGLMVALIIDGPAEANAGCCGEVAAITQASMSLSAGISSAATTITGAISESTYLLQQTIAGSADIIKGEATRVAGEIADNQNKKQVALSIAENDMAAQQEYMPPPDPCSTYSVAASGARGNAAAVQRSNDIQRATIDRNLQSSVGNAAYVAAKNHKTKYSPVSELPHADQNATSLTTGAGKPGTASYTFTAAQSEAARNYINNVTNSQPSKILPPEVEEVPAGQVYSAMHIAEQAKLSLATQPFADALAMREPVPGLKDHIKGIWDQMAANGVKVPDEVVKSLDLQGDQASYYFFQKTEIDRRANNPQWVTDLMAASPASVNREMAIMQAQLLNLQFQQKQQLELIAKLLGGIYAEQIKSPYNQQRMNDQYQFAKNSGGVR